MYLESGSIWSIIFQFQSDFLQTELVDEEKFISRRGE